MNSLYKLSMSTAKKLIHSSFDLVRRSSMLAKLMMKRSLMERSRKKSFQRLGELTYSLYKAGSINNSTLSELVSGIDDVNRELRKSAKELDDSIR